MMDKRPRKELIEAIRDSLRNFEETYDRKEWEHFQRQRKNKRRRPIPLFVKLSGIAASLFLIAYASVRIFPSFDGLDDADKNIPKVAPHPSREKEPVSLDTLSIDSIIQGVGQNTSEIARAPHGQTRTSSFMDLTSEKKDAVRKVAATIRKVSSTTDSRMIEQPLGTIPLQAISHISEFEGNKKRLHRKLDKTKWINLPKIQPLPGGRIGFDNIKVGFNITPALTNKGFALSGGVSAQIPLSSRFSTEVGVSYTHLKVGADRKLNMNDTVSLQTVGIRNSVGMVSIPVSLNYTFTENFSASLGLTPFRAVSGQRSDIRQSNRWVIGDIVSGDTTRHLVGERTRTKWADSLYKGNTYLGFIELSGRYNPPFLKKRNIVLSPFIAIPLGKLRKDEYHWLHGGLSIRLYLH